MSMHWAVSYTHLDVYKRQSPTFHESLINIVKHKIFVTWYVYTQWEVSMWRNINRKALRHYEMTSSCNVSWLLLECCIKLLNSDKCHETHRLSLAVDILNFVNFSGRTLLSHSNHNVSIIRKKFSFHFIEEENVLRNFPALQTCDQTICVSVCRL